MVRSELSCQLLKMKIYLLAEIKCVGEQLHDFIAERLGSTPPDLSWDASLVKSWFSLEHVGSRIFRESTLSFSRDVESFNWLDRLDQSSAHPP